MKTFSAYIGCMIGLFECVDFVLPEKTKLEWIVRNMSPFYLQNLLWHQIISINHLEEEARILEMTKSYVERYEGGNKTRGTLEPDLACKSKAVPVFSKPFINPSSPGECLLKDLVWMLFARRSMKLLVLVIILIRNYNLK